MNIAIATVKRVTLPQIERPINIRLEIEKK